MSAALGLQRGELDGSARVGATAAESVIVSRYFFHVYSDTVALDEEGQELASLTIAREAAIRAAREFAAEEITGTGQVSLRHRIEVEDENGRPIFTLPFSAAFRIIS